MTCGNDYEHSFEIKLDNHTYTFDSFECAIHKLAPVCRNCGCRILGHGVESGDEMFCCAHCGREKGVEGLSSRVSAHSAEHVAAS
ncbi:hypothetical protein [Enhygromyxa salina]|nr:hypothetical protein [Enhygromyxa salina]